MKSLFQSLIPNIEYRNLGIRNSDLDIATEGSF